MTGRSRSAISENPLVPHAVLRSIFTRMIEARTLDRVRSLKGPGRRSDFSLRGEEACRASAVACLEPGDLVSDPSKSLAADLMLGVPLRELARAMDRESSYVPPSPVSPARLPLETNTREQIGTALGTAHALKLGGNSRVVLLYAHASGLQDQVWRTVLRSAADRQLPVLFVLLPETKKRSHGLAAGYLSARSQIWGVPGIPVDGADAVALYRVFREAITRARAGDGPTLVECLKWQPAGRQKAPTVDPLIAIALALAARGAGSPVWQRGVAARFERRLAVLNDTAAAPRRTPGGLH